MAVRAAVSTATVAERPRGSRSAAVRLVASCTAAMLVIAWPPLLVSVLSGPMGLTAGALGGLIGLFFGTAAVLSPVGAAAVRRFGAVACLRFGVLVTVAVGIALAFSPGQAVLIAGLVAAGAANAIVQPSTNAVIRGALDGPARGLGLGVVQAAVPLTAVASAAVIPLVAGGLGWRAGFGFLGIAAGVALVASPRRRPGAASPGVPVPGPAAVAGSGLRRLLPFVAIALFGAMAASACSSFAVSSGVGLGLPSTRVAAWLAAAGGTCALVRIVGTRLAASWPSRPGAAGLVVIAVLLGVGLLGFGGLVSGVPALFGPALVVAYGFGWAWNGPLNLVIGTLAPSATVATGWTQAGVFGGSAVGPVVFALLVSSSGGGHGAGWVGCAAFIFAALVFASRSSISRIEKSCIIGASANGPDRPQTPTI